ncbi:Os04g0296700 [Oryza sativa Japonica Group]|uniref:Os04g0296700 protein n=1 Tax=Oryza sativa subsp. japonica TaxID=39947 RepID=A0A0N7KIS7_ORYSJ|nr:hypothetical protein EE612_022933 [Oryza sativa]BAS88449.1 Os04g0296700 [Oryza sativa Japonica Group]
MLHGGMHFQGRLYSKVGLCAAQLYVSASYRSYLVISGPCEHFIS